MTLIAYHGSQAEKDAILAQLAAHRAADEIIKGEYWKNGKGCAVGCAIHSGDHAEYEPRFGIPQMLAQLEDTIFEGLPNDVAQLWPERFMSAIEPGADLSLVGWKFLYWLLTDAEANGINDPLTKDAVRQYADVVLPLTRGEPVDRDAAARTAVNAAEWAVNAAVNAADAARTADWGAAEEAAYSRMADKLIELLGEAE